MRRRNRQDLNKPKSIVDLNKPKSIVTDKFPPLGTDWKILPILASFLLTVSVLATVFSYIVLDFHDVYVYPIIVETGQILGIESYYDERSNYLYYHRHDFTYYFRTCESREIFASDQSDLIWDEVNKPLYTDFSELMQLHGAGMIPDLLSPNMTSELRGSVLRMNANEPTHKMFDLKEKGNRWSLRLNPLDLTNDPHRSVQRALKEIAAHPVFRTTLEQLLGDDPAIVEIAAITSDPGAPGQDWHSDTWGDAASVTLGRRHSSMYSLFLYLQDTDESMGPTGFCPGTHMCTDSMEDCPCFFATPKAGTGVILNSQIVHQGSENTAYLKEDGTRVMFIVTFASRPRPGTEHRQLPLGSVYGIPWYMWGHNLYELDNMMDVHWNWKHALGIQKAGKHWGINYLLGAIAAHSENAKNQIDPQPEWFLDRPVWEEFQEIALEWLVVAIAAFVAVWVLHALLMLTVAYTKRCDWELVDHNIRALGGMVKPVFSINLFVTLLITGSYYGFTQTQWAQDVKSGERFHSIPFHPYVELDTSPEWYAEKVVQPRGIDILYSERLDAYYTFRNTYFYDFHPGNWFFRGLLAEVAETYRNAPRETQQNFIETDVMTRLNSERRFLVQDHYGHWVTMETEGVDIPGLIRDELMGVLYPVVRMLGKEIDFIRSQCKYADGGRGYGAMAGPKTALSKYHIPALVENLRGRFTKESWRAEKAKSTTQNSVNAWSSGRRLIRLDVKMMTGSKVTNHRSAIIKEDGLFRAAFLKGRREDFEAWF